MPEESKTQPILNTGEPEWFPPIEDDIQSPVSHRPSSDTNLVFYGADGLRACSAIALYFLVKATLDVLPRPPSAEAMALPTFLNEFAYFFVLVVAAYVISRIEKRPFARYGLGSILGSSARSTAPRLGQFFAGILWGLALLSLLVGILWKTGLLVFTARLLGGAAMLQWGLVWFACFLGVGFFEEYFARGFLQFMLARGIAGITRALNLSPRAASVTGFWAAALFFSVLFGLAHKSNLGESPIGLFAAGLIGFVFAFSLWRTGSLWWAIGYHAAWDWAESFLYGVGDSGHFTAHRLYQTHPVGAPMMSGGLTGPEGSIYVLLVIALTALVVALTLRSQAGSPSDPLYRP